MRRAAIILALLALSASAGGTPSRGTSTPGPSDVLVSVGSPATSFPQSWQNTPALAVDAAHPSMLAATAQDTIDAAACGAWDNPRICPFAGIGFAGVYFSFDGGGSWIQPTYRGLTRRGCLEPDDCDLDLLHAGESLASGPIGTVPNQDAAGVFSMFNPDVAFGPVPGADGTFSWTNGSRLYFVSAIQNLPEPFVPGFDGVVATAVSTIDGRPALSADIVADQANWSGPVIATRSRADLLTWAPTIWADNAASSPYFGTAYVCDQRYGEDPYVEEKTILGRSSDGGTSWRTTRITGPELVGEDYCHVRTDSDGTVHVFWEAASPGGGKALWYTRSFDGGRRFERTRRLAAGLGCYPPASIGPFAIAGGSSFIDGVHGVETVTYPSVDIANGAPSGADASDRIVLSTCQGGGEPNTEHVLLLTSADGGDSWLRIRTAAEASDRPNAPAIAISPDGDDVYLVYQGFLDPWRSSLSGPRRMQPVVRHADASDLSTWTTTYRGEVGDARASASPSFGGRTVGDLGIHLAAIATRDAGIALWTDIRNAARCQAIEAFRQSLVDGDRLPAPTIGEDCPPTFGNADIYGTVVADPT